MIYLWKFPMMLHPFLVCLSNHLKTQENYKHNDHESNIFKNEMKHTTFVQEPTWIWNGGHDANSSKRFLATTEGTRLEVDHGIDALMQFSEIINWNSKHFTKHVIVSKLNRCVLTLFTDNRINFVPHLVDPLQKIWKFIKNSGRPII